MSETIQTHLTAWWNHKTANFLGALLILVAGELLFHYGLLQQDPENSQARVEQVLHSKEELLSREMEHLKAQLQRSNYYETYQEEKSHYIGLYEREGLLLLVYEGRKLKFWSDHAVPVDQELNNASFHAPFVRGRNGWFVVRQETVGNQQIVGLILIKRAFPFENNYLANGFQKQFSLHPKIDITYEEGPGIVQIHDRSGAALFALDFSALSEVVGNRHPVLVLFSLVGLLLLINFCRLLVNSFSLAKRMDVRWFSLTALLLAIRASMILLQWPSGLYAYPFFGPEAYAASSLFPSLGDLFLNLLLVFYLVFQFHSMLKIPEQWSKKLKTPIRLGVSAGLLFLLLLLSGACDQTIHGLIDNSSISFNVNNLFELDVNSYLGILIIGLLLFTYFVLSDKVIELVYGLGLSLKHLMLVTLIAVAAYGLIIFLDDHLQAIHLLWPLGIITIISYLKIRPGRSYSFDYIIVIISVFALFSAYELSYYTGLKENRNRASLAQKIASDEDPITEFLLIDLHDQVEADPIISQQLADLTTFDPQVLNQRLSLLYLTGYLARYNFHAYVFAPDGTPIYVGDGSAKRSEASFFERTIERFARPCEAPNTYFLEYSLTPEHYLLKFVIYPPQGGEPEAFVYLTLESKLIPEKLGFPELLLDKKARLYQDLYHYSFAKYRDGKLTSEFGKYGYSRHDHEFRKAEGLFSQMEFGGYDHLIFQPTNEDTVVISKLVEGPLDKVTTFSYLFAFFSLMVLIFLIVRNIPGGFQLTKLNFNSKIQLLLVFVILTSMALFGWGTTYYIIRQNTESNYTNISERIQSVLIEVESKLGGHRSLGFSQKDFMYTSLSKFSRVFFTDINLFDRQGKLLSTSRPKLFNENLISRSMNPEAFQEMHYNQRSEFVHEERIGDLTYLSAYVPFKNKEGTVLAYLNLSYFAKQSELEREISSFLVALINIYVFLFALSVVAALLISNFITEPLRTIQTMLSKVELGKTAQTIEYDGEDEIGSLIKVYNEKVAELENSAELLARSERESAWREMAKQVAHEIKNPLTPMKLSVQLLQRAWEDRADGWDERLNRFSKNMIEQIDTLSTIASEFSNFAKMPRPKEEKLDILESVRPAIELYKDASSTQIELITETTDPTYVQADREQLIRVFNNLVKNAGQAIPEHREGRIEVVVNPSEYDVTVAVSDNGTGIPAELTDRIFVPNFTTKTSGMGLGLAMVKNMVENSGGKVWFETEVDRGTTFFVQLPRYNDAETDS